MNDDDDSSRSSVEAKSKRVQSINLSVATQYRVIVCIMLVMTKTLERNKQNGNGSPHWNSYGLKSLSNLTIHFQLHFGHVYKFKLDTRNFNHISLNRRRQIWWRCTCDGPRKMKRIFRVYTRDSLDWFWIGPHWMVWTGLDAKNVYVSKRASHQIFRSTLTKRTKR